MDSLLINEIFYSIQGESLLVGKPTVFVRTAGCNLRCVWCDTKYAFWEGQAKTYEEIVFEIEKHPTKYVCLTGGEPLGQEAIYGLMDLLLEKNYKISLETGGGFSTIKIPKAITKILDLKCPDSGESKNMIWENLEDLHPGDQVKFVVASKNDFEWAESIVEKHNLGLRSTCLISPVFNKISLKETAEWILASSQPFTLQTQLHKIIWGENQRGV